MQFDLNGKSVDVEPREGESLLDTLRNRCGITSVKDGCAPQGQCGCCLAMVGGKAVVTCAMKASKAEGKEVVTLDGLPGEETALIADCFAATAGLQCGFCIPGLAMRAHHLVGKNPRPSRDEIAKAIDVHLCRCTGYTKIVDAIELYAGVKRGEAEVVLETNGMVGSRLTRYQAQDLTLGRRDYTGDMTRPDMLHGALLLSEHARARLVKIDTSKAEALEGVIAVATAKSVPGDRWYGLIQKDWPGFVAEGEEVRCVGDFVAAVAAVDDFTARAACDLIEVEYEVLEAVTDMEQAILPGAPRVNPTHENALSHTKIRRGDVDKAFAESAHVVEGRFHTQRIEHLFLEPECAFAEPLDNGQIKLYTQGQGIFDDRRQCAAFIGVKEEEFQVELVPNGGAFGGKEDMAVQPHAALLCQMTGKPVRVVLTREQSIRVHPKRHPLRMDYKVGCDKDGHLTAVWANMLGDTGAYASVGAKVLERAAGHGCGPYRCDNVFIDAIATYTNNPPCGAMRGFGANQAHFAMSACMDMLAEKVGIDTYEIRHRNVVGVGDTFASGQVFEKSVGVKETLESIKDAYYAAKKAGKAVGLDCGIKNSGIGNGAVEFGKARLVVEKDGTISLYNGYTEMGQGLLTVLTQCAVEVTGLDPAIFRPQVDSRFALGCGQTTGSRGTLFGGRAVKSAAEKLKAALDSGQTLGDLTDQVFAADVVVDDTTAPGKEGTGKIKTHTAFGFATQLVILDADGKLEHVVASHDVGRAINPALCEGQIEGAVHMGLGFALSEDLPCENGWPVTYKMREIGVMRARDMPTIEVILVEDHEPEGPFGAKGVGEIGLVPTAGAVAGALYAHDGVRRFSLPMKDSSAGKAISVGKIKSASKRDGLMSRVNAHTHLYSGLAPLGMPAPAQAPANFVEILERVWWRLDRALDADSLQASCEYYVADALRRGAAGLIDHHESPNFIEGSLDIIADVCQRLGMPAVLCYGATERNGGRDEARRGLAECRRFMRNNQRPLVKGAIGLHACFTVSDETIREAAQLARELDTVLHVHVAEDKADVDDARKRGYKGLIDRLEQCEAMESGSIFAHGVYLEADEVRACADAGIWLVQNPRSNRGNKVGYPKALAESTLVALGTDGYEADMHAENAALLEDATKSGDDLSAADMRVDASAVLLGTFWDGVQPARGSAPDDDLLKTIHASAQAQATRLWQRMSEI